MFPQWIVASLVVVAFAFFAILSRHPEMDDTGWNVLVSVTAALAIHVMGLVSSLSLDPRTCDREQPLANVDYGAR